MANMEEHRELNRFIDQATAASWPFFAIATIVFGMRTVSQVFFTKAPIGWEDFIIPISWVCALRLFFRPHQMLMDYRLWT